MRYLIVIAVVAVTYASASCAAPESNVDVEAEAEPAAALEPATSDEFLDPIVVDGEHYKLEYENDYVRVLRENLDGGEGGAMHSHRERISVYLKDSAVVLTPRGGEPVEGKLVAGTTSWSGPVTHQGVTKSPIENLSIELKDSGGADIPAPEEDAVAVDPEQHTIDFENDRVRVVRMIYPPGSTTTRHAHRPGFGVALSPVHVQNLTDDGDVEIEYAAGETFWSDGGSAHRTKNLRDEELVILLVEMKKQPA